jgi:hypothetical protein
MRGTNDTPGANSNTQGPNVNGRDPAQQTGEGDPLWMWGLVPWWLGFTLTIMLIANHQFPASGRLALAGELALACGLVISGACMITALIRRSRHS